jgi:hypothetical protein
MSGRMSVLRIQVITNYDIQDFYKSSDRVTESRYTFKVHTYQTSSGKDLLDKYLSDYQEPPKRIPAYDFFWKTAFFVKPDDSTAPYDLENFLRADDDWKLIVCYENYPLVQLMVIQSIRYNGSRRDEETGKWHFTMLSDKAFTRFQQVLQQPVQCERNFTYRLQEICLRHKHTLGYHETLTIDKFKQLQSLLNDWNMVAIYDAQPI